MARDPGRDGRHDHAHELGEQLRALVVGKLAEKAAAKDRETAKGRFQAEALDAIGERISTLDLWTRLPPGERRTRISRESLAAAAMRTADAEGLAALSMRRLAVELGVGTMTLYHYVRSKEELLVLVHDAVMAEVVVPEPVPDDWREALTAIAHRSRDAFLRHPWMLEITDEPPVGPNGFRHFDQTMQAVASLDLPLADRLDLALTIDEFVTGYCVFERGNDDAPGALPPDVREYLGVLLDTGAYPACADLVAEHGLDGVWAIVQGNLTDAGRFERHLGRVLDGIAADLERRGH